MQTRQRSAPSDGLNRRAQRGAELIEFALVCVIFFTLLLGVMEFARWMFALNAANEATRLGARAASICNLGDSAIKQKMQLFLSGIDDSQITVAYRPAGCARHQCQTVSVALVNASFTPLIPFFGFAVPMPAFTTSVANELTSPAVSGTPNPACQ